MPTIPTGKLERELRAAYLRWIKGLTLESDLTKEIARFEKQSIELMERMGGQVARLGALADFPAPVRLDLSPVAGHVYNEMIQTAIQGGIIAGLQSKKVAQSMFRAGMDKSYRKLERLARTETVRAYWKNAWDSVAELPDIVMVWGAESGPRTCEWCLERDGMVIDSSELRDHPNGRCTPIPMLRTMVEYKGSVSSDGKIYHDPAWNKPTRTVRAADQPAQAAAVEQGLQPMSSREANAWGAQQMVDVKTMPKDIQEQIRLYTGGGYKGTNRSLRQGKFTGSNGALQKEMSDALDKAMKLSSVPEQVLVSRLTSLEAFPGGNPAAVVGKSIMDKGFLSTAVGGKVSGPGFNMSQVEMSIVVPAGTPALWTKPLSQFKSERELLLGRNSKLAITEATFNERTGKWLVRATVTK